MDMPVKPSRTQDQLDSEHPQVTQPGAPLDHGMRTQSDLQAHALHAQSSERSTSANDEKSVAQTGENVGAFVKNAAVGIDAHRIVPHRYEIRSIEPSPIDPITGKRRTSSVAGIFDPEGVTRRGAVGDYKVRFDLSHPYHDKTRPNIKLETGPHINFGTGEHLAKNVPEVVIHSAGAAARALEGLDHVAIPLGMAVDGARLANAVNQDGGKIGAHVVGTAGSVIGGWVGALEGASVSARIGAAKGAEIGAGIGVVDGGPIGAAIGGIGGGLIGGVVGGVVGAVGISFAGEQLRESLLLVQYAGNERPVTAGYQQSGTITSVHNGIVTQDTGRSCVEYKMADLLAHSHDRAAMKNALVAGNEVTISIDRDQHVNVTSLERNHNLEHAHRPER